MEKLSLWDRLFNRYVKTVKEQADESWTNTCPRSGRVLKEYVRTYVDYTVTDRVTGSVTIEREYLN